MNPLKLELEMQNFFRRGTSTSTHCFSINGESIFSFLSFRLLLFPDVSIYSSTKRTSYVPSINRPATADT